MSVKRSGEPTDEEAKRPRMETATPSPGALSQDRIRMLLEETKRRVAERMAQQAPGTATPLPAAMQQQQFQQPQQSLPPRSDQSSALMSSIAARMATLVPGASTASFLSGIATPKPASATKVTIDPLGRLVDGSGRVIEMVRTSDLKVNKDAIADKQKKVEAKAEELLPEEDPNFDERLTIKPAQRSARGLMFVEAGKYEALANRMRSRAMLDKLQADIASATKKNTISAATKLVLMAPKTVNLSAIHVPDVEWWDLPFLPTKSYEDRDVDVSAVTRLVQHPIGVQPPAERAQPAALPVMMTSKERKKLRRQRRALEEQEKRDKIRLGAMAAPAPKVKISNLMAVLGTDAIMLPTRAEQAVRAQVSLRQEKHQEANQARALTKEQKKEKTLKKLKKGTDLVINVAVFRINNLRGRQHKFKVSKNAEQLLLTGCGILGSETNVLIVEGSERSVKQYKKLMLNRIKWDDLNQEDVEDEEADADTTAPKGPNKCLLMWEGLSKKREFDKFELKVMRSDLMARDYLSKFHCAHHWDLALSQAILEDSSNPQ
eukprot:m.549706 g.549706  ORF g.549706 m.549706 type:complete len:547 (-) comp57726_c0_seq4:126-1766(-)